MADNPSRRSILRNGVKTTAGLGIAGSATGRVAASGSYLSKREFRRISNKAPVVKILEEVGSPRIDLDESMSIEISSKSEESHDITYYMLQTGAGVLMYAESSNEGNVKTKEAMFKFGAYIDDNSSDSRSPRSPSREGNDDQQGLREKYQDLTAEQGAAVLANEEETQFVRNATNKENEQLASELDLDAEKARSVRYESGFYVLPEADVDEEGNSNAGSNTPSVDKKEKPGKEQTVYDVQIADSQGIRAEDTLSSDPDMQISSVQEKTIDSNGSDDEVEALGHGTPACLSEGIACISTLALCITLF